MIWPLTKHTPTSFLSPFYQLEQSSVCTCGYHCTYAILNCLVVVFRFLSLLPAPSFQSFPNLLVPFRFHQAGSLCALIKCKYRGPGRAKTRITFLNVQDHSPFLFLISKEFLTATFCDAYMLANQQLVSKANRNSQNVLIKKCKCLKMNQKCYPHSWA